MRTPAVQFIFIVLAALSAFTLAPAKSGVREAVQDLFKPISWPVRKLGLVLTDRIAPQAVADPRSARALAEENAELKMRIGQLEAQLEDLKGLSAEYSKLTLDLRKMVHPASIVGRPPDNRQTLTISTGGLEQVREHMVVIHPTGLVGQISGVSTGGGSARVLLITDAESKIGARFVRYVSTENGIRRGVIQLPQPLAEGNGQGGMIVRGISNQDVKSKLQVGDVAELADVNWPKITQGLQLGTIRKITPPATGVGYATIELTPTTDFFRLRQVLVMDR